MRSEMQWSGLAWGVLALWLGACQAPPPPGRGEPAPAIAPSGIESAASPAPPEAPAAPAAPSVPSVKAPDEPGPAEPPAPEAPEANPRLRDPKLANDTAPERFTVLFETTVGDIHLDVRRSWAPLGADRFYNLVRIGYFDGGAFFRVVEGFVAQAGIAADPGVSRAWRTQRIDDDPVTQSNSRGMVSFAASGKHSRTTQFFINLVDNPRLDALGFAPIGRVRELDVAQKLYAGYGEGAPSGHGPTQARIEREGDVYLKAEFPKLDAIRHATVVDEKPARGTRP
jgi:peptidyl-prolyl cis-trans isomerase A (cyclophilin A)